MNSVQKQIITYSQIRERMNRHTLRQSEIPVGHAVSLPLPTKRWGRPSYAFFASPSRRVPGQPAEQGAPDRWWVLDACGGHLIVYALYSAIPFTDEVEFSATSLPLATASIQDMRQSLERITGMMDQAVAAFFTDDAGDPSVRSALKDELIKIFPDPLLPQYRALAPDFFSWLTN